MLERDGNRASGGSQGSGFLPQYTKKGLLSEGFKVSRTVPSLNIFRLKLGTAWWGQLDGV